MFRPQWLRTLVALSIFLTIDTLGAGNLNHPAVLGSIAGVKGVVLVDHHSVLDREVVFGGEVISTGASSGAYINLHGTVAILVENSVLALNGSKETTSMTLRKGAVEIRSGESRPAQVFLNKASVVVRNDGDFPSICRIASVDRSSVVIADKGRVEIHGAGAPMVVLPGKTVHLEAGLPQAAEALAGKVSAEIPTATIQHGGAGASDQLKLADPVHWKDLVATQGNGRVRIALEGGSFLNVGARSQMSIVRHDPQSQQTEIELKLGTLRGEVVKLTKGGKFETRTPTAVIGVVGTIYIANATPQDTGVWSVTGDVTVSNVNPNIPGTVVLHTGQYTNVHLGLPPSSPTPAASAQIQSQVQNTNVQEGAVGSSTAGATETAGGPGGQAGGAGAQGGTAGGGIAASAPGISTGITNGLTLAASGAAVAAGGVAIGEINQAHTNISSAESSLANAATSTSQAAADAAAAQAAATQAVSASQQASNIATTIANQVNSLIQGCGCVSPSGP